MADSSASPPKPNQSFSSRLKAPTRISRTSQIAPPAKEESKSNGLTDRANAGSKLARPS